MKCFARVLVIVLAGLGGAAQAQEEALGAGDREAIEQVIRDQLAAFSRDDGETAFGYASPGIRAWFGTATNFVAMVRGGYYPIYRAQKALFRELKTVRGQPAQKVIIVGPDGVSYNAFYIMERQPDGPWKIGGVSMFTPGGEVM